VPRRRGLQRARHHARPGVADALCAQLLSSTAGQVDIEPLAPCRFSGVVRPAIINLL
jgi:hypothetical protein